ncbi:hypothetical protein NGR_b08750 (plasmid) [Sinorhizobium fredii NGR234]|uniref:Uncharacterized protein n=1 Tax=Sinorhizobium fredii (strain NBRC 101917 / NGR234) TaxID=394 RepID=C3KQH3_SINFN|nr:hypothetical protein NGR_b08750 [Sinorhizobium fredii NGR234]
MLRSQMMVVGLFPLPGQLSASALIAAGGPENRHGCSDRSLQDLPVQGKTS